ncbi:hypothetical protein GGQ97_001197 [Sphingomonas kaistensis]|uniref:Uncharacterized protein n=1 Tax=Sphingomonas kaistensis TaxID=298708 RepID=A0A7X5Y583_9SPHN|nr:hypothetical protein [Sphingomonas kaistensis]NJC05404.1 hypothetical protein [Sphingomonas kaistensis]
MRLIVMGMLVMMAGGAAASTPAAWAQMDRQVTRACVAASGLKQAKIIADKASFSDRVPVELRIVEGYNRGNVIDVKLCAYDRRTRRATTVEGVGRLGVNRR